MVFAHLYQRVIEQQDRPFDVSRQPIETRYCTEPWRRIPESGCGWKRMEKRTGPDRSIGRTSGFDPGNVGSNPAPATNVKTRV